MTATDKGRASATELMACVLAYQHWGWLGVGGWVAASALACSIHAFVMRKTP